MKWGEDPVYVILFMYCLLVYYLCVSRASSLGVGAGCIHASLSPEGEGRFVQTETAALVRMAAAPQRRVQKHCKRREGCPPEGGLLRGMGW